MTTRSLTTNEIKLLASAREILLARVDKFFIEQTKYMIEYPEDYEDSEPRDFELWFVEWNEPLS